MTELLRLENVSVAYDGMTAVSGVSLSVNTGEIVAVMGESGCGKSSLLRAVIGLQGPGGCVSEGQILFCGEEITGFPEPRIRTLRGRRIGMVLQDAGASFCPVRRIGAQLREIVRAHAKVTAAEADRTVSEILCSMGFDDPKSVMCAYPFQLSGGMIQRVGIAAAMLPGPELLLADEPTSALDPIAAEKVIGVLKRLRDERGTGILLVTHDPFVADAVADRVIRLTGNIQTSKKETSL